MTKVVTQPSKETPKQRRAFLDYFELKDDRSIPKLYEEYTKKGIKISEISLKVWSAKYKWVERVQKMDQVAFSQAEEIAIKNATVKKSDASRGYSS